MLLLMLLLLLELEELVVEVVVLDDELLVDELLLLEELELLVELTEGERSLLRLFALRPPWTPLTRFLFRRGVAGGAGGGDGVRDSCSNFMASGATTSCSPASHHTGVDFANSAAKIQ